MAEKSKNSNKPRTIAEANPHLRDKEKHIEIILAQAIASAEIEGIQVSEGHIEKLREKLTRLYKRNQTALIP